MKKLLFILFPFFWISCTNLPKEDQTLNVMSFNIRLDTPVDGENAWPYRKEMVASMIRFHQADLAGLQEVLRHQLVQLDSLLPAYHWIGRGRDDGKEAGEYCPIFYKSERLSLLDQGQFWLSETPDVPGLGWDAACNRIVTWGKFRDQVTGKRFWFFNTHFDHMGDTARHESALLLKEKIQSIAGSGPSIISGDLNSLPQSDPYQVLTGDQGGIRLSDTYLVSRESPHGPDGTWSGFRIAGEPGRRIDYIFTHGNLETIRFGVLSDSWSGRFPSDHLPVLAEILVQ